MNDDSAQFRTPGQLLEFLLKEKGWTNRVLAVVLGIDENVVSRLVSGKRPIDAEIAVVLEDVFGVAADRFMDLQMSFDLAKARISVRPEPERATRAHLFGGLPIAEMIKRGWINAPDVKHIDQVQKELVRFFGVNRVEDIEVLPHAAKKTQVNIEATPAQLAWLYRVKKVSSEILVPRYSEEGLRQAIKKLSSLLFSAEEARRAPRILAEAGVRFVIVESLPSAKIDGVCFWLDEHAPVIGMSMRFDRIDNFWFVLRHECEHVLRGHGRAAVILDTDLDSENVADEAISDEELIANEAASEFCVPKEKMDSFIARKAPFFYEQDIRGFATTLRVHPGLVAGQLRHRTRQYNRFANHLVKVRSIVLPNAHHDGWGNVAPTD